MLSRDSRARLCLQERAPALYPHGPATRAAKGSATRTIRGTALAVMDEGSTIHLRPPAVSALQSSRERTAHCHLKKKEPQGHNWKRGSAELEGAVLASMFGNRQAVLKGDEKQDLT